MTQQGVDKADKPISAFTVVVLLVCVAVPAFFAGAFMGKSHGQKTAALAACFQYGFTDGDFINSKIVCSTVERKELGAK